MDRRILCAMRSRCRRRRSDDPHSGSASPAAAILAADRTESTGCGRPARVRV